MKKTTLFIAVFITMTILFGFVIPPSSNSWNDDKKAHKYETTVKPCEHTNDTEILSIKSDISINDDCANGYCSATTKKGYSCRNCAKSGSRYCGTHKNKNTFDNGYRYTSTCTAIAKSTGRQCRNKAKKGSSYCSRHSY